MIFLDQGRKSLLYVTKIAEQSVNILGGRE